MSCHVGLSHVLLCHSECTCCHVAHILTLLLNQHFLVIFNLTSFLFIHSSSTSSPLSSLSSFSSLNSFSPSSSSYFFICIQQTQRMNYFKNQFSRLIMMSSMTSLSLKRNHWALCLSDRVNGQLSRHQQIKQNQACVWGQYCHQ